VFPSQYAHFCLARNISGKRHRPKGGPSSPCCRRHIRLHPALTKVRSCGGGRTPGSFGWTCKPRRRGISGWLARGNFGWNWLPIAGGAAVTASWSHRGGGPVARLFRSGVAGRDLLTLSRRPANPAFPLAPKVQRFRSAAFFVVDTALVVDTGGVRNLG
jgi:hypothetical protein